MKAIHLICAPKHKTEAKWRHMQIKDGFVVGCDGDAFIKIPVEDVFGKGVIADNEELYIEAVEWEARKAHKAIAFSREGNTLLIHDKPGLASSMLFMKMGKQADFVYPDINTAIPETGNECDIQAIGVDPTKLVKIATAFGSINTFIRLYFYGEKRIIIVKPVDRTSAAIGGVMALTIPLR